jgi:hypothetical protein
VTSLRTPRIRDAGIVAELKPGVTYLFAALQSNSLEWPFPNLPLHIVSSG